MGKTSLPKATVLYRFNTKVEYVFDAWIDPEMIGQFMFGPNLRENETILHLKVSPKVGGAFSFLINRGGQEIDHVGKYLEIDRPRRLAFSWGVAGQRDSSTVTIDFISDPKGCTYTLSHTLAPEWAHMASKVEESWRLMSEKLEQALNKARL